VTINTLFFYFRSISQRSGDEDSERNDKWAGGLVEYHVPGCLHCRFDYAVMALEAFLSEEEAYLDFANLLYVSGWKKRFYNFFFTKNIFFIICCRKFLIQIYKMSAREVLFWLHGGWWLMDEWSFNFVLLAYLEVHF
jgi:hypothetical protein